MTDSARAKEASKRGYSNEHHNYMLYADGDITTELFAFERMGRPWDYNDLVTWETIERVIEEVKPTSILDIGCGVGTWAFRVLTRFPGITIKGVDIAEGQIEHAKRLARDHFTDVSDRVQFYVGDAGNLDREADQAHGLTLCLHDVLNHMPPYRDGIREMVRVGKTNITSVHTTGGPRTFYTVDPAEIDMETVHKEGNWLQFRTNDGAQYEFHDKLFGYDEITGLFREQVHVRDSFGVDIGVSEGLRKVNPEEYQRELPGLRKVEESLMRVGEHATRAEHIIVYSGVQ